MKTHLTPREREILDLIRTGMPSKEVANQLFLSKRTVDFHLHNVYVKLGVCNRMAAVVNSENVPTRKGHRCRPQNDA